MGSFEGEALAPARERHLQQLKCAMQVIVVAYVFIYAIVYKNTHLRTEQVMGNVYVDAWPSDFIKGPAAYAALDYCDKPITGMQEPLRTCGYVNEIDLLSFKPGNFIPTFVQVVHQKASCVNPEDSDLSTCQLDYKTSPDYQLEIEEYFIAFVEKYRVQITHAFQSDSLGQKTMAEADHFAMPDCSDEQGELRAPICYDKVGGGHDMSTVEGLLSLANLTLNSNNDETDHPLHLEPYRTSGMKLHVRIHYTNIFPWWSWTGLGTVGYRYEVAAVPAQSVWRSITVRRMEDMRAWVGAETLASIRPYDRILVWADGVDVVAHVTGTIGHLDLFATMVLLASAVPLTYAARAVVNCLAARSARVAAYATCEEAEEGGLPRLPGGEPLGGGGRMLREALTEESTDAL